MHCTARVHGWGSLGPIGACAHGRWDSVICCIIQLERSGQPKCTKIRRYVKCKSQERSQRVEYSSPLVPLSTTWDENLRWVNPSAVRTGGGGHVQVEVHAGLSRVIPYHWT